MTERVLQVKTRGAVNRPNYRPPLTTAGQLMSRAGDASALLSRLFKIFSSGAYSDQRGPFHLALLDRLKREMGRESK